MPSTRAAAQGISKTIAQLAAHDFSDSDDIMDITLINSSDSEEEQYYNRAWHHADDDTESEDDEDESGEEDEDGDDYDEDEQDDDDEEEEEDEDDDDPVVVPSKRKHGSNKIAADTAPAPRKIEYTTSVYTSEQFKRPRSSRGAPVSKIFSLHSNEPWDVIKSRIRSNIGTSSKPIQLGSTVEELHYLEQAWESIQATYDAYLVRYNKHLDARKGIPRRYFMMKDYDFLSGKKWGKWQVYHHELNVEIHGVKHDRTS
ncbi:hypothetical protein B0H13DRAFT_1850142 [Mycena leptocephala]|nr:hypothetical protein B0H13DRAFT_1850142 [Mycena leptocephala]